MWFTTQGSEKKVSFVFNVCTSKPSSKERHCQRHLYEISTEGAFKKKGKAESTRRPMFWLRVEEQGFVFKRCKSCAVKIIKSICRITRGKQICDGRGKETGQFKRFNVLSFVTRKFFNQGLWRATDAQWVPRFSCSLKIEWYAHIWIFSYEIKYSVATE